MAITVEVDGLGVRIVDTTEGSRKAVNLKKSLTVTEFVHHSKTVATGASDESLPFGGVSAGDILVVKVSGSVTLKVNGESTGHTVNTHFMLIDTAGGITSATVSQSTGSDVTVEYLVAG